MTALQFRLRLARSYKPGQRWHNRRAAAIRARQSRKAADRKFGVFFRELMRNERKKP